LMSCRVRRVRTSQFRTVGEATMGSYAVRAFGINRITGLGNAHVRSTRFAVRCFYREAPVSFVAFLVVSCNQWTHSWQRG
jgi:hypothetical protein